MNFKHALLLTLAGLITHPAWAQDDCQDGEGQPATSNLPVSGNEPERQVGDWNLGDFPEGWAEWPRERRARWITETEEGRAWFLSFRISRANNCYNYACNKRNQPGEGGRIAPPAEMGRGGAATPPGGWCTVNAAGQEVPTVATDPQRSICTPDMTCATLGALAVADGLVAHDCATACPAGSYKKALVLNPLTAAERADTSPDLMQTDYHWYRQDKDGTWSHKPGEGQVQTGGFGLPDGTQSGQPIRDPRRPEVRGNYTEFCACYCCGANVRKAQAPLLDPFGELLAALIPAAHAAEAEMPRMEFIEPLDLAPIEISMLVHSGRANPSVEIHDYDELMWLLKRLSAGEKVKKPCWNPEGLAGFAVHINRVDLIASSGLAPQVVVRDGLLRVIDEYRKGDPELEAWLHERFEAPAD